MTQTLETLDPRRIEPPHEVRDEDKLAALVDSMTTHGWLGAPIVVIPGEDYGWGPCDPQAITGSHRLAAAYEAGIDVPTVPVDDLLTEAGLRLADLDDLYGNPQDDHEAAIAYLGDHLPADVADYYGLDAH